MITKLTKNSIYLDTLQELFSDVFTKNSVLKDLENNTFTNYLVYILDNQPVAFINYYTMYERSELININVIADYQNQKIATKLMDSMIKDCIAKNISSITLEVKVTNQVAIHLYKKFGFQEVSIRKSYYQGIDAILMKKELM